MKGIDVLKVVSNNALKNVSKNVLKIFSNLVLIFLMIVSVRVNAEEGTVPLDKAPIDLKDPASLQRGAKLYMNYCLGCHGLKYLRYNSLATGIGIVDSQNKILEKALKKSFMFNTENINDPIHTSLKKEDGANWFGTAPPDLTLVTRTRSPDWVYTYLRSFFPDPNRPWGVNNRVFPDVAMPHVLANLEAELGPQKYDQAVADLVNFLTYAGEPMQLERKRIGVFVLIFLVVFLIFAILLKREYWKNLK